MSTSCCAAKPVISGSLFFVCNILTLKVAILTPFMYLIGFSLIHFANSSITRVRAPTSVECIFRLSAWREKQFGHMVLLRITEIIPWQCVLNNRHHTSRWVPVVSWLYNLILIGDLLGSFIQHPVKCGVFLQLDSSALLHIHNAAYHGFRYSTLVWLELHPPPWETLIHW